MSSIKSCIGLQKQRIHTKLRPTPPTAVSLHKLLQPKFPLPLKESWAQWLNRADLRSAETEVLRCVNLDPKNPHGTFNVRSLDVPVDMDFRFLKRPSNNITMNELEVQSTSASPDKHVVLVHGYGASKGFFYKNLRDITMGSSATLHALDWIGYGRSSRMAVNLPRFRTRKEGLHYAEDFFLQPFESWRQQRGIERFTFVAHSLGAYLACAYARKYPSRVEKIVLVSPASVNRTPLAIPPEELPNPEGASALIGPVPRPPAWFSWMWEQHWSPFSLVRSTGVFGPKLTSGWTARRFAELPAAEQAALQRYAYATFSAPGSGEYMLNYFLACGGSGRWPLLERLQDLKCPTLWLYGDNDWMPAEGGAEAVRRLSALGRHAEMAVVPDSGHHLYLDNPVYFREVVNRFLKT